MKAARTGIAAAALCLSLPGIATAQFVMDVERGALTRAAGFVALEDVGEGESALVNGPLAACTKDRTLFIDAARFTVEHAASGENFRIRRMPEKAVEIETVTTNESLYPRLGMALGLARAASLTDCSHEERLLRVLSIDGAKGAAELIGRKVVTDPGPEEASAPPAAPAPQPQPQPEPAPPNGWRIGQEASPDGITAMLVATLDPRTPSGAEQDEIAPRLKMRCENGVISVFVASGAITWDERPEVTLRIGNGRISSHRWKASPDGKAVGLWTSAEAGPFLERLPENAPLFVRLRDRNLIYLEYDLANVKETAGRIRQECAE